MKIYSCATPWLAEGVAILIAGVIIFVGAGYGTSGNSNAAHQGVYIVNVTSTGGAQAVP
jgi:hypothetical protein